MKASFATQFWSTFLAASYQSSEEASDGHCQGTSLAVCTPFIYPIYCSYSTFISLCLHICLLLFGYDLTLSCSQHTLFISLLLEPPCFLLAVAILFSLYRLPTLFRVISPLSLQVALTVSVQTKGAFLGSGLAYHYPRSCGNTLTNQ